MPRKRPLREWWARLVADQPHEKVLSIIRVRQRELESLVEEARARPEPDDAAARQLRAVRLDRATELARRQLAATNRDEHTGEEIDRRHAANELLDELDDVLLHVVSDQRLCLLLELELDRDDTPLTKSQSERTRPILDAHAGSPLDRSVREELETLLATAVRRRNDDTREERAAVALRQNYLTWAAVTLGALLAGTSAFAVVSSRNGVWADVLLATVAGALGATLSGGLRLRAPQRRLAALKNLGLVMLVQPLLGGVAGLVVFAVWRSGLLAISGLEEDEWESVLVVAFAGGFSEPFFLKTLARIAGSTGQREEAAPETRG